MLSGAAIGAIEAPATLDDLAVLCDSIVQRFTTDHGIPLSLGRATRTVPRHLFRVVAHRDSGCRFPGCDRPVRYTEAHHVHPWEHGGPTDFDNLALLCSRHHHLIHRPGWRVKLLPDATLVVTTPAGKVLTSHPPNLIRLQV